MIRLFLLLFYLLFVTVLGFSQTNEQVDVLFKNANIISFENKEVLKNYNLGILNNQIVFIDKKVKKNLNAKQTIDLKGQYILPALADAHVHLPENIEDTKRVLQLNIINGVTKVRSMRGKWEHAQWREDFKQMHPPLPKLHLSAPPISRGYDLTVEQAEKYVKTTKDYQFDFIKILSVKGERVLKLLDSLCKVHQVEIGGHFPDNPKGGRINDKLTFSANYTSFEHLGGLIGDTLTYKSRLEAIKKNNIFICPTLKWYAVGYGQYNIEEMLNQRGMNFIADSVKTVWTEKTTHYREKLGKAGFEEEKNNYALEMKERYQVIKDLNQLGVPLLLSPDTSTQFMIPGFNMLHEMLMYQQAGLSNKDILKAASFNYALHFKENDGDIALNKTANFIIVEKNPLDDLKALSKINGVFFNNHYYSQNDLEQLEQQLLKETNNLK